METKIERIYAISKWHHSLSDAQDEVDDELEKMEDSVIRRLENQGYEYRQGTTTNYRDTYDRSRDKYKSKASRVLYFKKVEEEALKLFSSVMEFSTSFEEDDKLDIENQLSEKVKSKIPSEKAVNEIRYRTGYRNVPNPNIPGGIDIPYRESYTVSVNKKLTNLRFSKLKLVASNLILGEAEPIGLPLSDTIYKWPFDNCGSLEQSFSQQFDYSIRKGFTIEFEKTIESSTSISVEMGFEFGGASGGASYESSRSLSIRNSRSYSEEEEESRTGNFEFRVAPNTKNTISLTIQQFLARRKFEGNAIITGELVAEYENVKVKYKLLDLLNENQRNVNLKGYYSNLDYREIPIKIEEKECE